MEQLTLLSAFLIGLLGSGHCLVMCGGVSTMLCSAVNPKKVPTPYVMAYHLGRLISYATAGAISGYAGFIATAASGSGLNLLRVISGVFLILMALYIGKWSFAITHFEKAGQKLWRLIQPLAKHVLPVSNIGQALSLGMIWGWLPCGLIYSALTWSLASGSAQSGALLMLGFGLGTMPAMTIVSIYTFNTKELLKNPMFNRISALLLATFGFYTMAIALRELFS